MASWALEIRDLSADARRHETMNESEVGGELEILADPKARLDQERPNLIGPVTKDFFEAKGADMR